MPLRSYRPNALPARNDAVDVRGNLTDKPHKPLTEHIGSKAGRNSQGKLTVRHQGGGPSSSTG